MEAGGPRLRAAHRGSHFGLTLGLLKRTVTHLVRRSLSKSELGKACHCLLNQWEPLVAHCGLGHTKIDNNQIENAIRPSAVGKKNRLFIGHPDAGDRILYSVIVSCHRHGLNAYDYLRDVLYRLPGTTNQDQIGATSDRPVARSGASSCSGFQQCFYGFLTSKPVAKPNEVRNATCWFRSRFHLIPRFIMCMTNDSKRGFTLVEIMIAVVLIGLLVAMAIPAFSQIRKSSQAKTCVNNLRQIGSAKDQYFVENGGIPNVALGQLVGLASYIKTIPACPSGGNYRDPLEPGLDPACDSAELGHVYPPKE